MNIRTDLALEAREISADSSWEIKTEIVSDMKISELFVKDEEEARKIGKEKGRYITFEFPEIAGNFSQTDSRISIIGKYIRQLLPKKGTVLVVGLGNRNITPDTLGVKSVEKVIATRHIDKETAEQTGIDK